MLTLKREDIIFKEMGWNVTVELNFFRGGIICMFSNTNIITIYIFLFSSFKKYISEIF